MGTTTVGVARATAIQFKEAFVTVNVDAAPSQELTRPAVADLFVHAAAQIHRAAAEIWPGEPVHLLHHVPSVTAMHAVRLEAADASVTVMSAERAVTDWTARYFGQWWKATEVDAESVCAGSVVTADVSPVHYENAALGVIEAVHTSTTYAKAQLLVARDEAAGVISAVSPKEELAYRSEPAAGRLMIYGRETERVATATARLAREVVRGQLLRDGWAVLHASAVVHEGRTILTFGQKGAGKTTTALALAAQGGLGLLANDRVFVLANDHGGVDVLPWPSAAALGLGLLDGLGWSDTVRERLERGETLHPTQDGRVTKALLAGRREPLWEDGKELKTQVWPNQFPDWFGIPLATHGEAAALTFPGSSRTRSRPWRKESYGSWGTATS